jgi:hypothetical protein
MKPEEYGEKYTDHLIEQYKLYVEMADNISTRRSQTNAFYITVLSGLLAVLALAADKFAGAAQDASFIAVAILGIVLCVVWYINLESYRQLNSGKYKTIHEMEQRLPFPCFDREWEIMSMRGEDGKPKFTRLTRVEKFVPILLGIPFLFLLVYAIVKLLN